MSPSGYTRLSRAGASHGRGTPSTRSQSRNVGFSTRRPARPQHLLASALNFGIKSCATASGAGTAGPGLVGARYAMSPFLICLASATTVWIATIVMSECAAPGRRGVRLYVLRFVIVPLTAVLPVLFLLAATGRAVMSTLIVLAALVCLAIANHAKARTLREPVVFSDYAHLVQVATNPAKSARRPTSACSASPPRRKTRCARTCCTLRS